MICAVKDCYYNPPSPHIGWVSAMTTQTIRKTGQTVKSLPLYFGIRETTGGVLQDLWTCHIFCWTFIYNNVGQILILRHYFNGSLIKSSFWRWKLFLSKWDIEINQQILKYSIFWPKQTYYSNFVMNKS